MNHERPYFLKTVRLGFGQWRLDDLWLADALWGDRRVTRLIGGPFSAEQVKQRLLREIETMQSAGIQYWPLFWLADGDFVGCCGLRPHEPEARIFAFGYHLCPAYWGMGVALEAGQAVIDLAFDERGAAALFAGHHPENAASRRVLAKLGFRFTHEQIYPPTGLMHPSYLLIPQDRVARK